jgi:hypothetical protein
MIDVKLKYQISIFLDARNITPTPDTVMAFLGQLKEFGFISSTYQEIVPPVLRPQPRLRLMTQNEEWNIRLGSQRIDMEKMPTDLKGSNLGEIDSFCSDALNYLVKINEIVNKNASRLAFITQYILGEMSEDTFSSTYEALFKHPSFYQDNQPFEWDWRSASRIEKEFAGLRECLNVITILKRTKGDFQLKEQSMSFDRILLTMDINTVAENSDLRFDLSHIKAFNETAQSMQAELLESLLGFISG